MTSTTADNSVIRSSDRQQLRDCLEAFAFAHSDLAELPDDWPAHYETYFARAGITSIQDLATATRDGTVNLDLDFLADVPPRDRLSDDLILKLHEFLPGPVGIRCFRLAQRAAEKVETGQADAKYVHRPESGAGRGDEHWNVSNKGGGSWTLHVDCAGFVRSTLKHVLSHIVVSHKSEDDQDVLTDAMPVALSDRSFMRAKDFYRFFESVHATVLQHDETQPEWRIVPDLRMLIAGDVVVYRPRGNAAGGAAFTTNDRSNLKQVLKAVMAAQLWRIEDERLRLAGRGGYLVKRNVSRDPRIKPWVEAVRAKLASLNITTVKQLRSALLENRIPVDADEQSDGGGGTCDSMDPSPSENKNNINQENGGLLTADVLRLMQECVETTALNTGHIVFVAGQPKLVETDAANGNRVYRVPVVHSTKHGKKDDNGVTTQGVQMHYRRFTLTSSGQWIRETPGSSKKEAAAAEPPKAAAEPDVLQSKNSNSNANNSGGYTTDDDADDALVEGPDEDEEESPSTADAPPNNAAGVVVEEEAGDDLAGLNEIEILAARMSI